MAIIFDFDRTLSIIETYAVGPAAMNTVWGGLDRVKSLEDTLKEAAAAGFRLAIVSRNLKATVMKALDVVKWRPYFQSGGVYGREDIIMGGTGPKSIIINTKIIQEFSLRVDDCIFLDDDRSNVSDIEHKVGCEVVHVRGNGLSAVDIAGLRDWVRRRGPSIAK